ncbi:MAG: fibrobacter succinogenes major paralogous domain-containing protein [Chitinophagia bacterium]
MKSKKYYYFFLMATYLLLTSCGSSNRDKAFQNIEEETVVNNTPKPLENSVKIGNQVWAKNNLNIDHFRNGDMIMEAKSDEEWEKAGAEGKPAWCYYNNDTSLGTKYGKLYNFYAVHDVRGLAPIGAHIASDEEWTTLSNNLGGDDIAGIKLKSTKGWAGKGNGDNSSGFNAMPGGYRYFSGIFFNEGQDGSWWTATPNEEGYAILRYLYSANTNIFRNRLNLKLGLAVRCIQD